MLMLLFCSWFYELQFKLLEVSMSAVLSIFTKSFFNCGSLFLNIMLKQLGKLNSQHRPIGSMPGLHISLGIFFRLFELLEDSCKKLDLALAQHSSHPDSLHSFRLCSAAVHKVAELEGEIYNVTEEAQAAEQLSTCLALKGYP